MPNKVTEFWLGKFGQDWTGRNDVDPDTRISAFKRMVGDLPVKSILEVGCNRGFNLIALSKIKDYELTGIDILLDALQKSVCPLSISLVEADCHNIPFPDDSFDLVFTSGLLMLFEIEDTLKVIEELIRVSKRYILVIEYPMIIELLDEDKRVIIGDEWDIEAILRYKGFPAYWAREYKGKFPDCLCIRDGGLGEFSVISYYWLFEKNGTRIYPVADCPNCGKQNIPFGTLSFIEDGMLRTTTYCLNCHNFVEKILPKGYLSTLELEEGGWDTEL